MKFKTIESESHWKEYINNFNHDFYHTWHYHQTILEPTEKAILFCFELSTGEKLAFPLIEREIVGTKFRDLVGAYGYSGPLFNSEKISIQEKLISSLFEQLTQRNYVSVFSRTHPVINDIKISCMSDHGYVVIGALGNSTDEIYSSMRKDHRRDIKKLKKSDFYLKVDCSPSESDIDRFIRVYEETMNNLNASESYYFKPKYYQSFFSSSEYKTFLVSVVEPVNNEVISSALMVNCGSFFQYHLSGTLPKYYKSFPMKLIIGATFELAVEQGASTFILGGGVGGAKDSLFDFKYGFTKNSVAFRTISKVLNIDAYNDLVSAKAERLGVSPEILHQSSFFPAYRATSV